MRQHRMELNKTQGEFATVAGINRSESAGTGQATKRKVPTGKIKTEDAGAAAGQRESRLQCPGVLPPVASPHKPHRFFPGLVGLNEIVPLSDLS